MVIPKLQNQHYKVLLIGYLCWELCQIVKLRDQMEDVGRVLASTYGLCCSLDGVALNFGVLEEYSGPELGQREA